MKVLFDTSVLVAGIVQVHPAHQRASPWMQRAKAWEFRFIHDFLRIWPEGAEVITSP